MTGSNVNLGSVSVPADDPTSIGSMAQPLMIKASGSFTVACAGGASVWLNENGKAAFVGGTAGGGTLNLVDSSALVVGGTVSFGTVNITAPSLLIFSGGITATNSMITAPVVTVSTATPIAVTNNLTFTSASSLTITGSSQITTIPTTLTLGGGVFRKADDQHNAWR